MVVHLGIVIMTIGFVGSGLFRAEQSVTMGIGDVVEIGGERLRLDGLRRVQGPNYLADQAQLTLIRAGRSVYPEKRRYLKSEMPMTESGIDSTPLRDVYVALGDPADQQRWAVHVYVNPLVQFIWAGGGVILAGLFLSLSGRARARREAQSVAVPATTA
jgi:cytochrome c-type biogenesis protein CcmF